MVGKENKVKPEKVGGTVSLPSVPVVKINKQAVENNESEKSDREFIETLKKASGKRIFPSPLNYDVS
ncbi:MAG: hypothetical protein HYW33_03030 [Candidatus Blackburnbacteria bacterium]|nr:hypothetical protein [Candidatus Blackburnbacteria bacterium]